MGIRVEALEDFDNGPDAFVDIAAVMANLDRVVTSDRDLRRAFGHLAGAIGKPTWMALKTVAKGRGLLDRTDSPWYPTMKLYWQRRAGDWDVVFARMAVDLEALSG